MSGTPGRSYEKRFEVAAPTEAVWAAITEGEELTRWFCQEASCEPGLGGLQHIDWGGGVQATQVITVWEPGRHLRTEAVEPKWQNPAAEPYALDWYLEQEGGITRIRMVASGFGEGPEWDHEYDGTFHGWDNFHKTLKHYLEHHRGQTSANVVLYATLDVAPEDAWERLMSPDGLIKKGSRDDLDIGKPFRFVTSQGDVFAGVVRNCVPGKTFAAMVESLNKAMMCIEMFVVPGGGRFLYISLNTWGLPKAEVLALGDRIRTIVYALFPQGGGEPSSACAAEHAETSPDTK
jgi:uncharacterized protein YndB with AHSA1/START domain